MPTTWSDRIARPTWPPTLRTPGPAQLPADPVQHPVHLRARGAGHRVPLHQQIRLLERRRGRERQAAAAERADDRGHQRHRERGARPLPGTSVEAALEPARERRIAAHEPVFWNSIRQSAGVTVIATSIEASTAMPYDMHHRPDEGARRTDHEEHRHGGQQHDRGGEHQRRAHLGRSFEERPVHRRARAARAGGA